MSFRLRFAFGRQVQQHGQHEYQPFDHLLVIRRDLQQVHPVAQHADQQRADDRTTDSTYTPEQAGAPQYRCGDGVQLQAGAGRNSIDIKDETGVYCGCESS